MTRSNFMRDLNIVSILELTSISNFLLTNFKELNYSLALRFFWANSILSVTSSHFSADFWLCFGTPIVTFGSCRLTICSFVSRVSSFVVSYRSTLLRQHIPEGEGGRHCSAQQRTCLLLGGDIWRLSAAWWPHLSHLHLHLPPKRGGGL